MILQAERTPQTISLRKQLPLRAKAVFGAAKGYHRSFAWSSLPTMRSTRAAAAVARLNARSAGTRYLMIATSNGLFSLGEPGQHASSAPLSLVDFVRFVDALGPQKVRRITKNDAAFAKQLVRKP